MNNLPFYIVTSDVSKEILPATAYLYNKYWKPKKEQNFKILGNHSPESKLPNNFEFIKIKNENNIQKWTRYLYDYILNNEKNDFFILSLDDLMPNSPLKPEIFEKVLSYAKNIGKVGRIAMGRLDVEKKEIVKNFSAYDIVRLKQDTIYRISCQTSIWNREYFLKTFNRDWTPWELELKGSKEAKNDGWEILGTDRDWMFGWEEESALSGRWPGMMNILGMRIEDVRYLIEQKIFQPEKLQYGIWYDCRIPFLSKFQSIYKKFTKIPKFSDIGENFSWELIKPYIRRKTFKRLYFRYKDIYK
jgi:hypothetical protein